MPGFVTYQSLKYYEKRSVLEQATFIFEIELFFSFVTILYFRYL